MPPQTWPNDKVNAPTIDCELNVGSNMPRARLLENHYLDWVPAFHFLHFAKFPVYVTMCMGTELGAKLSTMFGNNIGDKLGNKVGTDERVVT